MKGPRDGVICASFNKKQNIQHFAKTEHCCLAISVGQTYHEDTKLEATIDLINKTFAKCTLVLGDTLQRHNMINTPNPYQAALKLGDEWLERNQHVIEKLSIPHEIRRWDEWLLQKDYHIQSALIKTTYENDPHFKMAFNRTIDDFTEKFKSYYEEKKVLQIRQNSLVFLLEECAIIMLMWQQEHYHYIAYPGEMIDALSVTYERFVNAAGLDILKWLPIQFKRYSKQYLTSIPTVNNTLRTGNTPEHPQTLSVPPVCV